MRIEALLSRRRALRSVMTERACGIGRKPLVMVAAGWDGHTFSAQKR